MLILASGVMGVEKVGVRIRRNVYSSLITKGGGMAFDAMMLGVYKIPEITVNSGTDWVVLAGTLLTAFIVILGTWTTNKNFTTTTRAQEDLAESDAQHQLKRSKAEAVSRNRQEWINNVRTAISNFTAACFELRSLTIVLQGPIGLSALTSEEAIASATLHRDLLSRHAAKKGQAQRFLSEIQLFLNPAEQESADLINIAKNMYQGADTNANIFILCEELIEKAQGILKTEWEKVKEMI
jgi:hypothetical protein